MPRIPPQNRDLAALHPKQRAAVQSFIKAAAAKGIKVIVTETARTPARQKYLYSCNTSSRWVTDCDGVRKLSMHQYRIATDICIVDSRGRAVWDARRYRTLYALVPPKAHGLELIPGEQVHLQLAGSQAQYRSGRLDPTYVKRLGLSIVP